MVVVGCNVPGAAAGLALRTGARHTHHHAAQWRAQKVQRAARVVHQPGQLFGMGQHAPMAQRCKGGEGSLCQAHLQRCAEGDAVAGFVMGRENFQIRDVADRPQARSQPLELDRRGLRPAPFRLPAAVLPHIDDQATVAQHGRQRGLSAWRALRGGDADVDAVNALPVCAQVFDDGRGQRGHGAGASDGGASGGGKRGLQGSWKVAHKTAGIGQVDVVRARLSGGLGHAVTLCLKRPRSVDDQIHAPFAQGGSQTRGLVVEDHALSAVAQCVRQGLGAGCIAACHQQGDVVARGRVACQRAADACAKVAVPAQDQCFECCHGFRVRGLARWRAGVLKTVWNPPGAARPAALRAGAACGCGASRVRRLLEWVC
ncbi:hypothetical protein D3C71_790140 [compost metagenome]